MSGQRVASLAQLQALVGRELPPAAWLDVTQSMVDAFGAATRDEQWIHTDPVRAAAGPYAGTIAHGYLVLSLGPYFMRQILDLSALKVAVSYGADRIRFPAPMPVGGRIRMALRVTRVDGAPEEARVLMDYTFEREGHDKPVCVATVISQMVFAEAGR